MRFAVYVDREGSFWPPPERPPGEPVIVDVQPDTHFGEAVAQALRIAGVDSEGLYYFDGKGPYYSPRLLRRSEDPDSGLVAFPRVVIASDGGFLWTWGARDLATFADYERARDAGYCEGDPYGVFLERPMYGDGLIPEWNELVRWLEEGVVVGAVGWLVSFLRRHAARYRDRGAVVPGAFLDILLARDAWDRSDVCRLFGLSAQDAEGLLHSLGFRPFDEVGREHWRIVNDPDAAALRTRIQRDFLHYAEDRLDDE